MFFDVPHYSALIMRRTIQSLEKKGGLIPRSKEWWLESENDYGEIAKWNGSKLKWSFPDERNGSYVSGMTLEFGYMMHLDDHIKYGSTEYQYEAFDELTEFREDQFRFMRTRLRMTREMSEDYGVFPRIRAASNPIGPGVVWVKRRYNLPEGDPKFPFVPARLSDNARNVDTEDYTETLEGLDPIMRARMLDGDWTIQDPGRMFKRHNFVSENHPSLKEPLSEIYAYITYWDLAATAPARGKSPDWTCGVTIAKDTKEREYICNVRRFQKAPPDVEDEIEQAAHEDRALFPDAEYEVWMEQEPGSAGVNTISYYSRLLQQFYFMGNKTTGSKESRARPFSTYSANGNVYLINGLWQTDFLDEVEAFPFGEHDDQVDAASGAHEKLGRHYFGGAEVSFAKRPT